MANLRTAKNSKGMIFQGSISFMKFLMALWNLILYVTGYYQVMLSWVLRIFVLFFYSKGKGRLCIWTTYQSQMLIRSSSKFYLNEACIVSNFGKQRDERCRCGFIYDPCWFWMFEQVILAIDTWRVSDNDLYYLRTTILLLICWNTYFTFIYNILIIISKFKFSPLASWDTQ